MGPSSGRGCSKRHADTALGLLSDVVREPNLAQKDFERRKKLQLAELVRAMGSPGFLAQQAYLDAVFGPEHPYGHPVSGLPATVDTLTLKDVKSFYDKSVGPKAAALVMTGDVTLEEAVGLAKKYFGDWKGSAMPPPVPPTPAALPRQQVVYVPKPGLDQTMIVVGRPGIAVGHPDEYALDLATTVFGGFFGSRLNMNLREDKGYSYGAGASADARLGVGPLTASSAVRKDVTGPALNEFFREMKGIQERPITEKELASAREGLVRAIPGEFETVEGLGASAATLFFLRRPMDEFARTVEGLEKATPAEVQRVAEAYLGPAAMQVVLVGDPKVIQEQVGAAGARQAGAEGSGGAAGEAVTRGTEGLSRSTVPLPRERVYPGLSVETRAPQSSGSVRSFSSSSRPRIWRTSSSASSMGLRMSGTWPPTSASLSRANFCSRVARMESAA